MNNDYRIVWNSIYGRYYWTGTGWDCSPLEAYAFTSSSRAEDAIVNYNLNGDHAGRVFVEMTKR